VHGNCEWFVVDGGFGAPGRLVISSGNFFVFEVKKFKSLEVEAFFVAMLFCRSRVCG
jgi:hypothetical protein